MRDWGFCRAFSVLLGTFLLGPTTAGARGGDALPSENNGRVVVAPAAELPVRAYAGLQIGLGARATSTVEADGRSYASLTDFAAVPSLSVGAEYGWQRVALGAEGRVTWFGARSFLDIVAKPRVVWHLQRRALELDVAIPVGVRLPLQSDRQSMGFTGHSNPGVTVGLVGGITYFFTRRFGIRGELGWIGSWHRLKELRVPERSRPDLMSNETVPNRELGPPAGPAGPGSERLGWAPMAAHLVVRF